MRKRYFWAVDSEVFHDREFCVEACNTDDIEGGNQGDVSPEGRRLCEHCKEQEEYEAGLGHGDEGPA